jgi:hypothetical protein
MTGISLHMHWPLTSQLHGSVSQREQLFFSVTDQTPRPTPSKKSLLVPTHVYLPMYNKIQQREGICSVVERSLRIVKLQMFAFLNHAQIVAVKHTIQRDWNIFCWLGGYDCINIFNLGQSICTYYT